LLEVGIFGSERLAEEKLAQVHLANWCTRRTRIMVPDGCDPAARESRGIAGFLPLLFVNRTSGSG
jgi:hypothetical protein